MKNVLKSAFAALFIAAVVAACSPKTETTVEQDTVKVEAVDTTTVPVDTTAVPADTTAAVK